MRKWQRKTVSGIILPLLLGMLTLVFNVQQVGSVSPPTVQWDRTYGGTGSDEAHCVIQTSGGEYALAGSTWSYGAGMEDFLAVKYDSSGGFQWDYTFGGPNQERCYSIVETKIGPYAGGYALAGFTYSFGAGQGDFLLVQIDSSGNYQWDHTYGTPNDEWCYSVVETSGGGYALAGFTRFVGAGAYDFYLVKTDEYGNFQWDNTFGGTNDDFCYSIIQTSSGPYAGGYALAGETRSFGALGSDFYLVQTDSGGYFQWDYMFGTPNNEWCWSVAETKIGPNAPGYVLAGETDKGAGNYDCLLVQIDSNGYWVWDHTYGGASWDGASSVVQTSDGGYALTGWTLSYGAGGWDLWVIKTDYLGNVEWDLTLGGTGDDWGNSLVQTSDGGYALGGATASYGVEGSLDFWLIKLAPPVVEPTRSLDKSMSATIGRPGDIIDVTITITVPPGETAVVEDTLPMELKYVWNTFLVDGGSVTPSISPTPPQKISTTIPPGTHTITFKVIVIGGPGLREGKVIVTNVADATWYVGETQVDSKQATVDITIAPRRKAHTR